jgi:hypothetical protein
MTRTRRTFLLCLTGGSYRFVRLWGGSVAVAANIDDKATGSAAFGREANR